MKKILSSLLIVPSFALAQIVNMPTMKVCTNAEQLVNTIEEFGELPLLNMISSNIIEDAKVEGYKMVLFTNPKTGTFTLVEQWNEDFYCVVALGGELKPYINSNTKPIKE